MGPKDNRGNPTGKGKNSDKNTVTNAAPAKNLLSLITELTTLIPDDISESDLQDIKLIEPANVSPEELVKAFSTVELNRQVLEIHRKRFADEKNNWERIRVEIETNKTGFDETNRNINAKQEEIEKKQNFWEEKEKELNQRKIEIERRETNAKVGFTDQLNEVIDAFENRIKIYQNKLIDLESNIVQRQVEAAKTFHVEVDSWVTTELERIKATSVKIDEDFNSYVELQKKVQEEQKKIRSERIILARDQKMLNEDRALFDQTVKDLVEAETQQTGSDLEQCKKDLMAEQEKYKKLNDIFLQYKPLAEKYGLEPQAISDKLESLENELGKCQKLLLNNPTTEEIARLRDLDAKKTEWEDQRWRLESQIAELNQSLVRMRINSMDIQNLREERDSLLATKAMLLDNLNGLRKEIDRRINAEHDDDKTFPNCSSFDQDIKLQDHIDTEPVKNLKEFAIDIQNRIANAGLFYKDKDIRSFLGGLASGQLLILQGISGTGKTSLPVEFAKIVNGERKDEGYEVIEVQAGWRDRDDLIGYYNAFEKKFYEKKFLQALYQAQCAAYRDRIFFVVLDEMNLSYVEQYFADFLSALERPEVSKRRIDLITRAAPNETYPNLFVNENRSILIPPNIWFVGTSNQDETTKDIADKTYDRAHIMELPSTYEKFSIKELTTSATVTSYNGLIKAFNQAAKNEDYKKRSAKTWAFFDALRPSLNERFSIGWGNRLKEQFERYAPVVFACGGSDAEAADAILMAKVLRKIRGKYEIKIADLDKLTTDIQTAWYVSTNIEVEVETLLPLTNALIQKEKIEIKRRQ